MKSFFLEVGVLISEIKTEIYFKISCKYIEVNFDLFYF